KYYGCFLCKQCKSKCPQQSKINDSLARYFRFPEPEEKPEGKKKKDGHQGIANAVDPRDRLYVHRVKREDQSRKKSQSFAAEQGAANEKDQPHCDAMQKNVPQMEADG